MVVGRCNNLLRRPFSASLRGRSGQRGYDFRLLSNTTTLRHSPFVAPLFFHPNGLALACSAKKNRYGHGEYSFSTDTKNGEPVSHEELWETQFKELKQYKKENGDTLVPSSYANNPQLGRWVNAQGREYKRKQNGQRSRISDERIHRLNEIGFVWDVLDAAWEEMFQELKKYKEKHGETIVPHIYKSNPKLGVWVRKQRQEYKDKLSGKYFRLTDEREARLNGIGFVWDALEATWQERFLELKNYKKEHGNTLIPHNYQDNPELGTWVSIQRHNYKLKFSEKGSWLTDEREARLNEIGFIWDANEAAWEEMFQELEKYKEKHSNTLVPKNYADNPKLGTWVRYQRQNYKDKLSGKDFRLTDERQARLNGIGFVWDALDATWEEMFVELKKYKKEHGDTLVRHNYENNPKLGTWVDNQRKHYKVKPKEEGSWLTDEQIARLNEIGFILDTNEAAWEERFQELKKYKRAHGDTLVPRIYEDNLKLGRWVDNQRQNYEDKRSGKDFRLTDEREARLNGIGFIWVESHEAVWRSYYNKLCRFYERTGHTKVPFQCPEHKELYSWCMRQRYSKPEGSLKDDRCHRLEKINFDFFKREVVWGSLIENTIIYELENKGHEFHMTNEVFFGVKYRPDGVIFVDDSSVIFVEVDEKYHSYKTIEKELGRMMALKEEAEKNGYKYVTFVRIGTGNQRELDCSQLTLVSNHLQKLKSTAQWKSFSVHYVDYPSNNRHVLASKEGPCDEVRHLFSSHYRGSGDEVTNQCNVAVGGGDTKVA